MRQKEKYQQNNFLPEHFSTKLERLTVEVGSAVYQRQNRRLVISDEAVFYAGVARVLLISQKCFEKQLKMMGFSRKRRQNQVEYRWKNRQRLNLSKEMNLLTSTLRQQGQARRQLIEQTTLRKKQVDQMLEDMIFRLLVKGSIGKEQTDAITRITNTIQQSVQEINTGAVKSVEGLQSLYEQELKLYKKIVSNGDESN